MNNYITLRKKILKIDGKYHNIRIIKLCDGSEFFQVQECEHRDFANPQICNFVTYKNALKYYNDLANWIKIFA